MGFEGLRLNSCRRGQSVNAAAMPSLSFFFGFEAFFSRSTRCNYPLRVQTQIELNFANFSTSYFNVLWFFCRFLGLLWFVIWASTIQEEGLIPHLLLPCLHQNRESCQSSVGLSNEACLGLLNRKDCAGDRVFGWGNSRMFDAVLIHGEKEKQRVETCYWTERYARI